MVYPLCVLPFLGLFYEIGHQILRHIKFVSIWWPCLVVFSLHGNDAGISGLPFSDFLWFFFSPHRPIHPKPGNLFDPKRTKRGWPKPYGFVLGFLTTLLLRVSVYFCILFYFVLFFVVGKINWNCTKTLNIPFGGSRTRIKKKNDKRDDLLTARAMGWG